MFRMANTDNIIKKVDATEKIAIIQDKTKARYFLLKKKYKKSKQKVNVKQEGEDDFIKDVKETLRYGNIGHGVLLDKKV